MNIAKLGLGTAHFGGARASTGRRLSDAEAFAAVALAADAGVRLIDTSPSYGEAERVLGRVLPSKPVFGLMTKTAPLSEGLDAVERRARDSLRSLGVTRARAILVQSGADLWTSDGPALWRRVQALKDEGLFEQVGISACPADDPRKLARRFKPDLMQLPVSLLDQRLILDGTLSELAAAGVQVQFRSIFLQGLLFLPRHGLPAAFAAAGPRLSRIRRTIAEAGADPLQAALTFALGRPEAKAAIVSVASPAELRAVLAAAAAPAPMLDWSTLALEDARALDPRSWAAA